VGLSEFSRRQAALKQELVFACWPLTAVALNVLTPSKAFLLGGTLRSGDDRRQVSGEGLRRPIRKDLVSGPLRYLRERVGPLCRCLESSRYC
jgi:hypothetical protein